MTEPHLHALWDDHAPAEHKGKGHGPGRVASIHHGHRHADGSVKLHDEPWQMVRCLCDPNELVKLPFEEGAE